MKDFIACLRQDTHRMQEDISSIGERIAQIHKETGLSDLQMALQSLIEKRDATIKAIKAVQAICIHDWDEGEYETRYHYYTCKICGACKGDC